MRVAIVGAGVSGLVTAHLLHRTHDVTVFEAGARAGGHTNTVTVETEAATHEIDTGFIVFNDRNYPNFERLLAQLGVAWQPSSMTFSVSDEAGDFEYNGSSPNGLFAKRAHLVTPWFHRMVADLVRFNREARDLLASREDPSLRGWLADRGYSRAFVERLIVPQAAAVWSADPAQMGSFPARFLVEFFDNHGMLGLRGRPRWRTIRGGSRRYVEALIRAVAATGCGSSTPVIGDPPPRRPRDGHAARRRARALRRGRARRARRPGAGDARRRRPTASTSCSARSRTSPTRRCCTPTRGCSRAAGARGRAGTTTCSPRRPAGRR